MYKSKSGVFPMWEYEYGCFKDAVYQTGMVNFVEKLYLKIFFFNLKWPCQYS